MPAYRVEATADNCEAATMERRAVDATYIGRFDDLTLKLACTP